MDRKELQRMFDEAADQAATQAAALVIHELPKALKMALKSLFSEYRREFVKYIFNSRWIRALTGLLFLLGLIGYWLKERR